MQTLKGHAHLLAEGEVAWVGCQEGLVAPMKEFHPPVRYVDMSVSGRGGEEDRQAWLAGRADSATHQEVDLVTDPVGLSYSYPPPNCVGVLNGYSVLVVVHTDSVTSNLVRSVHPGSFHVNLHMNFHVSNTVSYLTSLV